MRILRKMKKLIAILFLINIFSSVCYGAHRYTSEQLLERIERASINLRPSKMEKAWKSLCEQDKELCAEKKDWYEKTLYDTKVRQHDVYMLRGGFHIKY